MANVKSCGTLLTYNADGGSSFTNLGYITDISGVSLTVGEVDVTNNASGCVKQYKSGWRDPGVLSADLQYDAAQSAILLSLIGNPNIQFSLLFTDDSVLVFDGYIKTFDLSSAVVSNEVIKNKIEIKLRTLPAFD